MAKRIHSTPGTPLSEALAQRPISPGGTHTTTHGNWGQTTTHRQSVGRELTHSEQKNVPAKK